MENMEWYRLYRIIVGQHGTIMNNYGRTIYGMMASPNGVYELVLPQKLG
jgi:hypothetical protein